MRIRIAPLTADLLPAARAFNARLGADAPFFLPEKMPSRPAADRAGSTISLTHYVALDEPEVRGGFLAMDQPAWVNGKPARATNYQSILSEGIRDKKYGLVSVHMLRHIEQVTPYAFMVGMGGLENSLPRLLKGAGWTLRPIPFFFRVVNVGKFLREARALRKNRYLEMAARVAAISGGGWTAIRLMQARPLAASGRSSGVKIERAKSWSSWADEIWARYRDRCSFAVTRDRATLAELYPFSEKRLGVALVSEGPVPIGWAAWLDTPMAGHNFFGNLRVATILDCVAAPEQAEAVVRAVTRHIEASGPDLLVTNQAHALWIRAFRRAGFLPAASNYILATSRQLSAAIREGGGEERVHLTRGDGDGRIHL
jgi:hypothetical protein